MIKKSLTKIHIPLETNPVPYQNNIKVSRNGAWKTEKLRSYQEYISYAAKAKWPEPPAPRSVPFNIKIHFNLKDKRHGDLDNMAKSVMDALEGVLFENDKMCNKMILTYDYADKPSIVITYVVNGTIKSDITKLSNG